MAISRFCVTDGFANNSPVHRCSLGSHSQHAQSLWSYYHGNRERTTWEAGVDRSILDSAENKPVWGYEANKRKAKNWYMYNTSLRIWCRGSGLGFHGATTTSSSRQGHYFQLKQDSLRIIFDLSLTQIPPTSRWQPGSTPLWGASSPPPSDSSSHPWSHSLMTKRC